MAANTTDRQRTRDRGLEEEEGWEGSDGDPKRESLILAGSCCVVDVSSPPTFVSERLVKHKLRRSPPPPPNVRDAVRDAAVEMHR